MLQRLSSTQVVNKFPFKTLRNISVLVLFTFCIYSILEGCSCGAVELYGIIMRDVCNDLSSQFIPVGPVVINGAPGLSI